MFSCSKELGNFFHRGWLERGVRAQELREAFECE